MKISTVLIAIAVLGGMYFVKNHVDTSALTSPEMLQPKTIQAQR